MKVSQEAIYNLVGGNGPPNSDQVWKWTEPQKEQEITEIIKQALNEIPAYLADIWIKRELENQDFDTLAPNRERARQLHAKAARRLRGQLIKMDKVLFLKDSIGITYVPDGPRDPAWLSIAKAAEISGLSQAHLRYLARENKVKSQKHHGMVYIRKTSLKTWIESEAIRRQI